MKVWSDKWACTGETKGGTIPLMHHNFIITSQYSIEDIFGPTTKEEEDTKISESKRALVDAVRRRFKVIRIAGVFRQVLPRPQQQPVTQPAPIQHQPDQPDLIDSQFALIRQDSGDSFNSSDFNHGTKRAKTDDIGLMARKDAEDEVEEIEMDQEEGSVDQNEEMITT